MNDSFSYYIAVLRKYFVSYCAERLSELGVTYSQLFVLICVDKKKECSPKEISEYLRLDAGQLNRTLTKLSEKKLITQRKRSDDKRFNILSLTEAGAKIVEDSRRLFYEWDEIALSGIDEAQRGELTELMKKLVLNLEKSGRESTKL